jgi:hypothetical protein
MHGIREAMTRLYQMVELTQRRCDLRFGIGACEAEGSPLCYQTWATCKFKSAFNLDGVYRWRFVPKDQTLRLPYSEASADDITGHAIPCIRSISTSPTRLNIGSVRRGESPFGVRSTLTVDFDEFASDDRDGDFYLADRVDLPRAGFWQKFIRRVGDALGQIEARLYTWYEGQDLSEAVVTRFDVRNLVVSKAGARLECDDPLQRLEFRKAQFPRATGAILRVDITANQIAGIEIAQIGTEISADYGNTGSQRYLRINREIIGYTGWSESDGIYTLTGVTRGQGGTEATAHPADDAVQRVGRYVRERFYRVALDLMENHSTLTADLIDSAGWEAEGQSYLPTLQTTAWVVDPQDVNNLIGELCRDGLFHVWWDERGQLARMQAVRPPVFGAAVPVTQSANIMQAGFDRKPDDRLTRVTARYNPRDPFSTAPENYRIVQVRIDGDAEGPFQADATIRENAINSRWINTIANGRLVGAALIRRYNVTPEYVTITLDKKDAGLGVGSFIDLTTPDYVDGEGRPLASRWEVIAWEPNYRAGTVQVEAQQSPYEGKFAVIMADGTDDYEDVPEDERDPGCWLADGVTGLMPDGTEPYLLW